MFGNICRRFVPKHGQTTDKGIVTGLFSGRNDFPLQYAARFPFLKLRGDFQSGGPYRFEVETVVSILGCGVRRNGFHFFPTAAILIIEFPRGRHTEVSVVVVEVQPVHFYARYGVSLVEVVSQRFFRTPFEPPVMVRFGRVRRTFRFPLVVYAPSPAFRGGGFRGIFLDSAWIVNVRARLAMVGNGSGRAYSGDVGIHTAICAAPRLFHRE